MEIDTIRIEATARLDQSRRAELGQFFTPSAVANYMAGMFTPSVEPLTLMEPSAGIGSLVHAASSVMNLRRVEAWEIDPSLMDTLESVLSLSCSDRRVHNVDFLENFADLIEMGVSFDRAILNPPYRKIGANSSQRIALEKLGVRVVNLYTAFVAASLMALRSGGEMVAIIPRSCLNGVYHRPFRDFLLANASIDAVHVFQSRRSAFSDDDVLQENVIVKLTRGGPQGAVTLISSTDSAFSDLKSLEVPFDEVLFPEDLQKFIRLPMSAAGTPRKRQMASLSEFGVEVGTGPIVEYRVTQHSSDGSGVSVIGPKHLSSNGVAHPSDRAKVNYLADVPSLARDIWPKGHYVAVKRISSKESHRRIVAHHIRPHDIPGDRVAFENHLNVFHSGKTGLDETVAIRLCEYLNSAEADDEFRSFSGSTQVNATDLKAMTYPEDIGRPNEAFDCCLG